MTNKPQEPRDLIQICTDIYYECETIKRLDELTDEALDWHNKRELQVRIEARIEEIEHVADYTNGMTHQMFENLKFRIAELEAERDRLNPSKSTPFNELKERDNE